MSDSVPVVLTAAGRTNTPPATLYGEIIANAESISPGVTFLPAGLIEDMGATATGAVVLFDQGVTEIFDSITPYGANEYLLTELAQIYLGQGATAAAPSNTAVFVVFTGSAAGIVISPGFLVGDGTNQYAIIDGGITLTGNSTQPLFARCITSTASFAVPANTVTTILTSVPSEYTLTVTNPLAGTPGGAAETAGQFRSRVLQSGLVAGQGTPDYLKALLQQVPGVQSQLISIRAVSGPAWEIIVGGTGDPYAIAYAVFQSGLNLNTLVGSTLAVTGITNANPGVVTTDLDHGYATGQVINIAGVVGMSGVNGTPLTITVLTETTFSIGVNTTSSGAWTSGGVVTPNFRNVSVTINSYPDSYTVPLVIPPVQTVTMVVTWNTLPGSNFVSNAGVASLAQTALAAYVNAVFVGAPMSLLLLNDTFVNAVASILPETIIDVLVFSVSINGIVTAPGGGTQTIFGDPESYFLCAASGVTVQQG